MLDTFRDAAGTTSLRLLAMRYERVYHDAAKNDDDRSRSRTYPAPKISIAPMGEDIYISLKNSDPRSRERGKPRIISLGVTRADALSTCQSHLDSPDSSSFADVPKGCVFAETRG